VTAHAPAHPLPGPAPELVEVAAGVFAYVQAPGGWCVSNAGVLLGPDGAVVVDTLSTLARARRLAEVIDGLAPGPGRTLVNTHFHGDHFFGNQVFGPGATIVAHEGARAEMEATGLALTGLWPDVAWGDIDVTLPTHTFTDAMTLHLGERRVELLYFGPAHTHHDVVAWLPDDGVLFTGDVVLSGATPFTLMGSIAGSLAVVERLRSLGAATLVCGHGPVAGPGLFDETTAYLTWMQELAAEGWPAGVGPLEMARRSGFREFGHLLDRERIVGNLHVAYAELAASTGDSFPVDVVGAFGELVEFNDGVLPTCLA
jgi:cyclase